MDILLIQVEILIGSFSFDLIHVNNPPKPYITQGWSNVMSLFDGAGVLVVGRWTRDYEISGSSTWPGYRNYIIGKGQKLVPAHLGEFGYLKPDSEKYCQNTRL